MPKEAPRYEPSPGINDNVLAWEFRRIADALGILYAEGIPVTLTSVTDATYTMTVSDRLIVVDASSNDVAVTMTPASAFTGRTVDVERMDLTETYGVTLTGDGGELIEDVTTQDLYPGESMRIYSNGSNWRVL